MKTPKGIILLYPEQFPGEADVTQKSQSLKDFLGEQAGYLKSPPPA